MVVLDGWAVCCDDNYGEPSPAVVSDETFGALALIYGEFQGGRDRAEAMCRLKNDGSMEFGLDPMWYVARVTIETTREGAPTK